MLDLYSWSAGTATFPPISELQTREAMTQHCTPSGNPGEGDSCESWTADSEPHCSTWNVNWTAWLAQSIWNFDPLDAGLPGYGTTSLEVYHSDLDDTVAGEQGADSVTSAEGVQATYSGWATSHTVQGPPNENYWPGHTGYIPACPGS